MTFPKFQVVKLKRVEPPYGFITDSWLDAGPNRPIKRVYAIRNFAGGGSHCYENEFEIVEEPEATIRFVMEI